MGCHFLLQWIFPTQGSNLDLLHCRQILYHLSHQGSSQTQRRADDGLTEPPPAHLQRDICQDVVGKLRVHESQAHNGLQLAQVGCVLQVEDRRLPVPLLVLLAEAASLVVAHHGQMDLPHRRQVGLAACRSQPQPRAPLPAGEAPG